MQKKISTVFLVLMLVFAGLVIVPDNGIVKANPEQNEENIELDLQFIKNITTNLSRVIHNYPVGMLPEGRAFGSKGERYATDYIVSLLTIFK